MFGRLGFNPGLGFYSDSGGIVPNSVNLIAEGDSITNGFGLTGHPSVAVPSAVDPAYTYTLTNIATSGVTTTTMLADYATRAGNKVSGTKEFNALTIMAGTNDGAVSNRITIYKNLRSYIRAARASGYTNIGIGTLISKSITPADAPEGNGYFSAGTLPLNENIRDLYNSDLDADGLIDFGNDPLFNDGIDADNVTYYGDTVHPTQAGQNVMATIYADAIDQIISSPAARVNAPATWSPFDLSQYLVLSNSDRTVKWGTTGFNWASVRSFIGKSTGKWYWELLVDDNSYTQIGIVTYDYFNAGGTGGQTAAVLGQSTLACGAGHGTTNGNLYINNVQKTTQPNWSNGNVLEFALDADAKLFWYRIAGNSWNGSGSANPATGVGGVDISSIGAAPYYPAVQIFADFGTDLGQFTSRFTAAQFSGSPPSGFSALG